MYQSVNAPDEQFALATVPQTVSRFGRLDILVNSAGIIQAGGVKHANTDEWRRANVSETLIRPTADTTPM
jgi:NADP-dependent 3-hydroxy acid dehydrogenase YdfG